MSEFRRIMMSSFLMLLLHFTAADVKPYSRIVRAGDEVTLPFDNVIDDQDTCEYTTWYFRDSRSSVTLFEYGQIHKEAKAKSDRLRVTEKCSLVIKKVTEEDAGSYLCRQFRSEQQQRLYSWVFLSVVTSEDKKTATTTPATTKTTTTTTAKNNMNSGDDAGKVTAVSPTWTTVNMRPAGETTNTSEDNQTEQEDNNKGHLRLIIVSVGLAALIITVVTVNMWTRAKGSKAQTEENMIDEDEDEDEVNYENDGEPSASV
ncbi:uncharacterized protein LOC117483782 isoform X2 [Trematomus bernacchii]|uniref:uncharacterized protein LOC117483782 isoform X2 n=1 Tax=Trematomus bernacchii TaxID=40690 RepID=UPI00146BF58F|nr:uncharacterized protein LOC117483782 isoform X2 [Trematomus bernacchii]